MRKVGTQVVQAQSWIRLFFIFLVVLGLTDLLGVWRDKLVFSRNHRPSNTPKNIEKAASNLFPRTAPRNYKIIDPTPSVERPYPDIVWLRVLYSFDTDLASASGTLNLIKARTGCNIWSLRTVIEGLHA